MNAKTLVEMFKTAYKINTVGGVFCQITALFRISKKGWYVDHPVVLTVRRDGSDIESEVKTEIKFMERAYDQVELVKLI